jgi:hypothetical protein
VEAKKTALKIGLKKFDIRKRLKIALPSAGYFYMI